MNFVKTVTLVLLLSVLATPAHAGSVFSKLPLFQCGLHFGSAGKIQKEDSRSNKQKSFASKRVVKFVDSTQTGVAYFTTAPSKPAGSGRLPPTVTFAKFRCSW
jgi:hypothetical protein